MANFIDSASNQGQPWRSLLKTKAPQPDGHGQLVGPWGDAIRAAVLAEKQGQTFGDGAAGQVMDFLNDCGHSKYEEQADKTEQASHKLTPDQIQALLGTPAPMVMGIPSDAWSPPSQQMMGDVPSGYAGVGQLLNPHNELEVVQVNFNGCDCCCCCRKNPCKGFPCCCCLATSEFEVNDVGGNTLLIAYEESGVWERNCCEPNHALTMKVLAGQGATLEANKYTDFNEEYQGLPKLLTLERKGCSNCYCTQCFSCCDNCNDNMAVYEGDVMGKAGALENAPKMMTMLSQPIGGGIFTPTINVQPQDGVGTPMTVKGPCIFGGWSEICCDSDFKVSATKDGGDVATIKHVKPDGCCELMLAFCTPLDRYKVTFHKPLSGHDKANVVISSFLVDYMFFELDEGPCYFADDYIKCTFFFCSCFGCLCPCECKCYRGQGGE